MKKMLAQRQKYRSMEQNRKSRVKSMYLWTPYISQKKPVTKGARIYHGGKTASSIKGARKTEQLCVKE